MVSMLCLFQRPVFEPVKFLSCSRPPWFAPGFQQDCSEFLKYLIDQLHEQHSSHMRQTHGQTNSHVHGGSSGKAGREGESGGAGSKSRRTLVENNFGGKMCTTIKCLNCGKESRKDEMFIDLPLAFPEYNVSPGSQSLVGGSSEGVRTSTQTPVQAATADNLNCLHLNDLLKHYLKAEKLTDDNKYYCDKCDGLQEAERKIHIAETPEYLILTLLRFSYDTKLHSRSKVFREVKYPKTLLLPVDEGVKSEPCSRTRRDSFRSVVAEQLESCGVEFDCDRADVYALNSVVIHSGTSSDCGHYYCYARHSQMSSEALAPTDLNKCTNEDQIDFLPDKWYLFNDSRVSYASYSSFCNVSQRFTKDTAYVLVYKKLDLAKLGTGQAAPTGAGQPIEPSRMETRVRMDLREAVVKDNQLYLKVQTVVLQGIMGSSISVLLYLGNLQ